MAGPATSGGFHAIDTNGWDGGGGPRQAEVFMRSIRMVATGIGLAAVLVASATGAEEKALGTRLVDQMNALYGTHPGTRANHATGACSRARSCPRQAQTGLAPPS